MVAKIISGKQIAEQLRNEMKLEVAELKQNNILPHLSVILIGDDPASHSYVNGKERASKEVGISSDIIKLPAETTERELIQTISNLNENDTVHGILVQLPLPEHINEQKIIETIDPKKDVDGFHPTNIGRIIVRKKSFLPCTPYGIIKMLQSENISIEGKHVVVVGRSNIVGKPMGQLLLNENATVTYCHSRTKDIQKYTKQADIIIVAIGKANAIDASYIKENAVVIDVGVNRTESGKLTGDVHFDDVKNIASFITPVPGGVGPLTITMLLMNTVQAAKALNEH